jgi:hypothetical protein
MNGQSKHLENVINKKKGVSNLQVVFVDIEKYSNRRTAIQSEVIGQFAECLRQAHREVSQQYVDYAAENNLNLLNDVIILPTGDGAAIVFSFDGLHDIHLNYAKALLKSVYQHNQKNICPIFAAQGWCMGHSNFNLRVGISEGKGLIYLDLNGRYNVAGDVINMAARAVDLVGRNQIAFTKDAYRQIIDLLKVEDSDQIRHFVEYPEISVKHAVKLKIYQYTDNKLEYLNSKPLELNRLELDATSEFVERHREIETAGIRRIYPDRQNFFNDLFKRILQTTSHELKIMGICISLFREAERPQRKSRDWDAEHAVENILETIERGCSFKVLFLKRYPNEDELRRYGISAEGDFFLMRERDEDPDYNFTQGKRLKKIANRSLGYWIKILIGLAQRMQEFSVEDRRAVLNRLQIREYLALPGLSLYIADDEIYVTPYLYKRHCSTVPSFQVAGKTSPLYKAYDSHFESTWADEQFTASAIDGRLIQLLVDEPKETLELYEKKHEEIDNLHRVRMREDTAYLEDPECYRVEEKAIREVLNETYPSKMPGT